MSDEANIAPWDENLKPALQRTQMVTQYSRGRCIVSSKTLSRFNAA
jgi:hypothetical protein